MIVSKKTFLDFFSDPAPALEVKFSPLSDELPLKVLVRNKLGGQIDKKGKKYLESICKETGLKEFNDFYSSLDGFELCIPVYPPSCTPNPGIKMITANNLHKFTDQYTGKGKWAWTIDLNKSKTLYRGNNKWVAFAEVDGGPSCLTIFLTGENAGCIYLVSPQPHFNILKPISKSFSLFLERVVKDPAAFLRLIRSYVSVRRSDGQNYGYVPMSYLTDSNKSAQ